LSAMARRFADGVTGAMVHEGAIYVSTQTRLWREATRGDWAALTMLASLLAHEDAHLAGANEADAYALQLEVFDALVARDRVTGTDRYRQVIVSQLELQR